MLKTIKDYFTLNINEKKNSNQEVIIINASEYEDSFYAFFVALQMSLLKLKPVKIKYVDLFNERVKTIIDIAKKISAGKVSYEQDAILFRPIKINYKERKFFYENSIIFDNINFVLPIFLFAPNAHTLIFEGITEFKSSIDRLLFGTLQKFTKIAQIVPKVEKRAFLLEPKGRVELLIRPNFKFNKKIYLNKIEERFDNILDYLNFVKHKIGLKFSNKTKKTKKNFLIKGFIHSDRTHFDTAQQLKKHMNLLLQQVKVPVRINDFFSAHVQKGISVTIIGYYSKGDEIDFSLKNNSFDIYYESCTYSKLTKTNKERIIEKTQNFIKNYKNKVQNKELQKSLILYDFIFDDVVDKEYGILLKKF